MFCLTTTHSCIGMSIFLLTKDVINIILEKCVDYSESCDNMNMYSGQPTLLKHISRFSLTCKYIHKFAQKYINDNTYTYHIFQKHIHRPDIVDHCGVIYNPQQIGNNVWFLCIKSSAHSFMYVDLEYYNFYGQSDRYFQENVIHLNGCLNSVTVYSDSLMTTKCFCIHYKANYGEVLLLTWYHNYHHSHHHHVKMTWTEGDVWLGIVNIMGGSHLMYRYEVCIDNGGPIIRKEKQYRLLNEKYHYEKYNLITDLWDYPSQLDF